jgi:MFS family permease
VRKAFQQKGFPRLFAGMTTSMLGDSVMLLVLSMWVKTLTGSNGAAGLTFFWMMIPALFAPLYGMYIDRIRRKPLLVWGNVISAVMVTRLATSGSSTPSHSCTASPSWSCRPV